MKRKAEAAEGLAGQPAGKARNTTLDSEASAAVSHWTDWRKISKSAV